MRKTNTLGRETLVTLTKKSTGMLINLLGKLKWPLEKDVFHALMPRITSIPIELCVLDRENRVLTFYRKDDEYDGHHMPGTVLRDNENVSQTVKRLIQSELVGGDVTAPKNIGWTEIPRGNGRGENPTRHEISLLFITHLSSTYHGGGGVFSPFDALPDNILPHHRVLVEKFRQYLEDGKPILG